MNKLPQRLRTLIAFGLVSVFLAPSPGVAQAQALPLTRSVEHPAGLTIRCPADWTTRIEDGNLVLLPPNPNPLGTPPRYLLVAMDRGDFERPDDPRVIERLDAQSQAAHPETTRIGDPEPVPLAAGEGVALTWEGAGADGVVQRARAYVGLVGDRLVMLLAGSSRIVLRGHEPTLEAIFATVQAPGAGFAGRFESEGMIVVLEIAGDGYGGRIEFNGQVFPAEARAKGNRLTGSFRSGESRFEFTATLEGDILTLLSGGSTYRLQRAGGGAPANPLAGGPTNPLAGGTGAGTGSAAASQTPSGWADFGPVQPDPGREWTIAVYLDGDNDLESFALSDLIEMEFGLPAEGIEIVVLIDRARGYEEGAGDWTDARVFRVRPDRNPNRIASEVLCSPGELNMGDPDVLAEFLGATYRTFPSRARMLILWDHGGGWAQMANDFDAPGTPEGHDRLELPELGTAVRAGLAKAGMEKLDMIGFDMCLMAQLETATELQGLVDVMIASQAIEPGNGWPYDQVLPQFGKGTLGSRRLAQEIVRAYSKFYDAKDADVATLSALDLQALPAVLDAFNGVVARLMPAVDAQWPALSRSLFYAEAYADRTDVRRGTHALASIDLLDGIKRMRYSLPDWGAEKEYRALVEAMDRLVLASHSSAKRRLSNGLSIYAPVHGDMMDPVYGKTALATGSAWPAFLGRIHEAQSRGATQPRFSNMRVTDEKGSPIGVAESLFNHRLSFTLEGDNIIWTQVWFGRDDAGAGGMLVLSKGFVVDPKFNERRRSAVADVVDLIMPEYIDGKNELYQDLNGVTLKVTDGESAFDATIDGSALDDLQSLRVPVLLSHPSFGEIGGTIVFDACWWQVKGVIGEFPQPDGDLAYRQIDPPADTQVTLLFEVVTEGGDIQYARGSGFAWGEGPELLMDVAAPGTYRAAFIAETISGRSAVETISFDLRQGEWLQRFKGDLSEFDAHTLVGTWDHYLIGEHDQPTGLVFEISLHPEIEGLLVAKVTSKDRPEVNINQVLWPDRRLFPSLRIFEYDDKGNQIGFYVGACGYGIRNGKPTFVYKMADVTRISAALVKRGAANGAPQTGGQPAGQPDARPAAGIVGTWQDGAGTALVCSETNYELYMEGEMIDYGVYELRGDTLVVQSYDGEVVTYRYTLNGNTLTLADYSGTLVLHRRE